jgi:transposase
LITEAGDLRRFRHHRQFLKFCGMDLATMQSGRFRGRSRISKFGNARLRRTLWIAGQAAVLKPANRFRDRSRGRGDLEYRSSGPADDVWT